MDMCIINSQLVANMYKCPFLIHSTPSTFNAYLVFESQSNMSSNKCLLGFVVFLFATFVSKADSKQVKKTFS